jgi:two-component system response regulator PilR (NtrC family)
MVWDLVVTDHTMPDMTGLDLIAHIRQKCPDMVAILCTGFGHTTTTASALSAGAYLTKPRDLSELARAVARLIRKPTAA